MNVGELMTSIDAYVAPDDPLSTVVSSMRANRRSCVLISINGKPLGILTERDIVRVFNESLSAGVLKDCAVSEVMTRDPICLLTSTHINEALLLADSHKIRHFPVVDVNEKLVGLVSQAHLANAYLKSTEQKADLEKENTTLKTLLHEDALMGIGNRRAMEVELNFSEADAKRYDKTYAVALLDVDWFGKYNNHYGHQMGDQSLFTFASTVKNQLRENDKAFRYGGEEVLLLMPDTMSEEAYHQAERARQAVEDIMLPHCESNFGYLTLSIGVALGGKEPWPELVKRADAALFQAKDSGRNRVVALT